MTMTTETEINDFDLSQLESTDEGVLAIKDAKGKATGWLWTFYGPGHPKTVAVANRAAKRMLDEARDKEKAQVNGKKWQPDEESFAELQKRNVRNIVDRLKTFTPVKLNGERIEFSPDKAAELLLDPRMGKLLGQVQAYLQAEESFTQPSASS